MSRVCRVPSCTRETSSRFAAYCTIHKARIRRHGAPHQRGITKGDLAPYVGLVQARVEKNRASVVWDKLREDWDRLVDRSRALLDAHHRGRPGCRWERAAAHEIVKLADTVDQVEVAETALAMIMLWDAEPRRFLSDRAFDLQLVRRVRGLTYVNFGERYQHETGKVKRYYREFPPRAAVIMSRWLLGLYGSVGLRIAELHRKDAEQREQEQASFRQALSRLE